MVKKGRYYCYCCFGVFFILGIIAIIRNNYQEVKSFELEDYQYYLENSSSKEYVGDIMDAKDAVEKAEKVWINIYGENVKKERPYQVFYDEKNNTWLIQGTFRSFWGNAKGGVANILIEDSNGKVLAVWHDE